MAKKKLTEEEKDAFRDKLKASTDATNFSSLTIQTFGGGQDSTTILEKLIFDKDFRGKYAPDHLVVVMSDTGNEHDYEKDLRFNTYRHTAEMMKLAKSKGIPMFLLTADLNKAAGKMGLSVLEATYLGVVTGYHTEAWSSLTEHWVRIGMIGSVVFDKSCTSNLKIEPIYRFLEEYIGNTFGITAAKKGPTGRWSKKTAIQEFEKRNGKIRALVGIARNEESRVKTGDVDERQKWMSSVKTTYPLMEIGFGRKECQEYIESMKPTSAIAVPSPSNCMFCPWLSPIELLWLSRKMPKRVDEWVVIEAAKLRKYEGAISKKTGNVVVNHGAFKVNGKPGTLREAITAAEKKFGHMTNAELDDYKMSHGHCVATKY